MSKKTRVQCMYCGESFMTYSESSTNHKCGACRAEYAKAYGRYSQKASRGTIERKDVRRLLDEYMFRFGSERIAKGLVKLECEEDVPLSKPVRCRFCGRMTVHASGFCAPCRNERLDSVYKVTGRSNGWDMKDKTARPKVSDSWRGTKIMGGFSQRERNFRT